MRQKKYLGAAVDTEIKVSMDVLMCLATTKKQRDLEGGRKAAFTLEAVNLGNNKDGEQITSCTVQQLDVLLPQTRLDMKVLAASSHLGTIKE